jgi:hypothetical protein
MSGKRISKQTGGSGFMTEAIFVVLAYDWTALQRHHTGVASLSIEDAIDPAAGRAFWERHRDAVIAEAKRRGVARPLWAEKEYDGAT